MKTIIRNTFLVTLMAALVLPTRAGDSDAAAKDMKQLQGEWSMVSATADGQTVPPEMLKQMKRVCKGDEVTTTMNGTIYFKAKITLDPSKKPKTIDYDMVEGIIQGKKALGIYEVDGDTFKSCIAPPGTERPTEFSSKPGDGRTYSVWKREKARASGADAK